MALESGVTPAAVVTFFDVDNTLFDNDGLQNDLRERLLGAFGAHRADEYWSHYEALRLELGYADYLGALQRFRRADVSDVDVLELSGFLLDYPFAARLYPGALEVVRRFRTVGQVVILSDGDAVFQPRKIQQSGLWDAVGGEVLIYVHKEEMLDAVARRYPAAHYVMVDDKVRILAAMKEIWGARLTTVFPRQGHYAIDAKAVSALPAPDRTVERIGDLVHGDPSQWIAGPATS